MNVCNSTSVVHLDLHSVNVMWRSESLTPHQSFLQVLKDIELLFLIISPIRECMEEDGDFEILLHERQLDNMKEVQE